MLIFLSLEREDNLYTPFGYKILWFFFPILFQITTNSQCVLLLVSFSYLIKNHFKRSVFIKMLRVEIRWAVVGIWKPHMHFLSLAVQSHLSVWRGKCQQEPCLWKACCGQWPKPLLQKDRHGQETEISKTKFSQQRGHRVPTSLTDFVSNHSPFRDCWLRNAHVFLFYISSLHVPKFRWKYSLLEINIKFFKKNNELKPLNMKNRINVKRHNMLNRFIIS